MRELFDEALRVDAPPELAEGVMARLSPSGESECGRSRAVPLLLAVLGVQVLALVVLRVGLAAIAGSASAVAVSGGEWLQSLWPRELSATAMGVVANAGDLAAPLGLTLVTLAGAAAVALILQCLVLYYQKDDSHA